MTDNKDVLEWWSEHPMTYGSTHGETEYEDGSYEIGTREFFERLDEEFFHWNSPLHNERPFDRLFPFDEYGTGKKILEVGCGLGTMAMQWAKNGATVTAVDLNPTAIEQTRHRFSLFDLQGNIQQQDATELHFPDHAFDYVYSWGVLHHSPNLETSLSEMMRVLKPGGRFGLMLYNRKSLLHWYSTRYVEGFLHYEKRFLGSVELASRYGDGSRGEGNPYTWPVTRQEVVDLLEPHTSDISVRMLGTELDGVFKLLLPGLGLVLPGWVKKPWARRFGWSLWFSGHKV